MADQILSLFLGKLLDYTAVPVGRQFSYLFCYNGNLEEFRNQLRGLEMAGLDVKLLVEAAARNGEAILPSVADWLKRVDSVSEESKRFVGEEDAISKCCFNGPLNLKVRYQRSRKAKKKAAEFDAIKKDGRFDSVSLPAPPLQIGSVNNENEFDFESRRSIFNEIMEVIKDDGVTMIGIWGMPGIGKTTLVKRVAKYAKDEGRFDEVAMAVVSQNPSVKDIQGEIADHIGLKLTSESERGRASQLLQRLLDSKKKLIILDDIWDSIELNDIGIPSASQHKGCKIILTTRNRGVCEEMGTRKNFKIDLLSANEALCLFMRLSGIDDPLSEKGLLAENLSEECGRLPISIAITARGLLYKEQDYWTDVLNRLRNSDPDRRVQVTIELSYEKLGSEKEKMFFLLCALFPEDCRVPVEVLFEYGLGLNLFAKVNNVDQAIVRAHNLVSRLKSQCLFLDEGEKTFVKMHDVVRDVALTIASEGKHRFLVRSVAQWREWPGKSAISLLSDDVKILPDALDCPQLQILMLNCKYSYLQLHDSFFSGMKNLIVLDMSLVEVVQLPQSFAALENLRTLRLSHCNVRDISAIGKLQNLVSLTIRHCSIEVLPKEVGELSNLRLLDLECKRLRVITPGVIQNLSQLEVLRVRSLFPWYNNIFPRYIRNEGYIPENASLSELIPLSRLMILEISILFASMLPDDVRYENLTKFKVSTGKNDYETMNIFFLNSQILVLANLSNDVLLKAGIKILMKKAYHLELERISGISVALASHIDGYQSLNELIVQHCVDVNYVLDMTESQYEPKISSLQLLHLIDLPLLKEISKGEFPSLFVTKLESLKLFDLPSLVCLWPFQDESNLTTMEVDYCNELEYVFDHISAKSLSKLKKLEVRQCRNLQAICRSKEHGEVIVFPHLSHLRLWELENLTSFGSKFDSQSTLFGESVMFHALETLDIYNLEKLEKMWHIQARVESFFQLKVLELRQCPELRYVFPPQAKLGLPNLEEIWIEDCEKLETLFQSDNVPLTVGDEIILFPRLLTLKLVNLPKFTAILRTAPHNTPQVTDQRLLTFFPKLKKLRLEGIFQIADQLHIIKGLEALEELIIKDNYDKTLTQVIAILPKLRKLQLDFIHESMEWCESLNRCGWFQSLTSLKFFSCNGVKSLLRPSAFSCLVQLQELCVILCQSMESIIEETSGEHNFDKAIEFSKLRTLSLGNLPSLYSFYKGESALKFPCLVDLSIANCPKLKAFASMSREMPEPICQNFVTKEVLFGQQVSFGKLSELELWRLESIEGLWLCIGDHPATTVGELSRLKVGHCDKLLKLFPSNLHGGMQNLKSLYVESCRSLEHVLEVKDHSPLLSNLEYLTLMKLPQLKQLWWNKNSHQSFGLPNLRSLKISTCPALRFIFDPSVANCLENLRTLTVEHCSSIVEIAAEKPGEKMVFPLLQSLRLVNLPCFKVNQNVEFPWALSVVVERCVNIKGTRIV